MSALDVADRIFAAIEAADAATVAAIYADDIVVWHSNDGIEQTKEQNLRVLDWLLRNTTSRQYREVRRHEIDGGFVQQHELHVELPDGGTADLPACIVAKVTGDRITRIDEYIDSTAGAAFT